MKTIKTKNELPDWFKNKKYDKRLSAINWYREIRRREYLIAAIHYLPNLSIELLVKLWLSDMNEILYHIPHIGNPVNPLSLGEALYLSHSISEATTKEPEILEISKTFDRLIEKWLLERIIKGDENPKGLFSRQYEDEIGNFYNYFDDDSKFAAVNKPVIEICDLGNPLLSYGRPLSGTPITIDTQFDDQTILESVKSWLSDQRKAANEKAKRPFNQNDFDDWTYYKIREVYDLDIWAILSGVRIQDKVIASALWSDSNDEISPIDILRTTTRTKIKEVFTPEVAVRFYGQLLIQEGENFLEK